jgi:multiple sugar transport system substrate-binding protein
LRTAADAYAAERPGVRVTWDARSLQRFADQSVAELDAYDFIVLDHPSIGEAVERGAILPLDDLLGDAIVEEQRANSVGRSAESYVWDGTTYALATDAAAQVAVYRADLLSRAGVDVPRTWGEVLSVASTRSARSSRGASRSVTSRCAETSSSTPMSEGASSKRSPR